MGIHQLSLPHLPPGLRLVAPLHHIRRRGAPGGLPHAVPAGNEGSGDDADGGGGGGILRAQQQV